MNKEVIKEQEWYLIKLRKAGRNYFCRAPKDFEIKSGDYCLVEVERAEDYARVLCKRVPTKDEKKNSIVKKFKRLLTDKDWEKIAENEKKAHHAYLKCVRRIEDHKLRMKLVNVEYSFDCSRIIFYFTADGRVDFRELVKSLATEFRARIELRQIGVRDETGVIGGIACCGRELCCCSFLYKFEPVTIKMAKDQRLPLNPAKISGLCGRLLCCLRYEYPFYKQVAKSMPLENSLVSTPSGKGRIVDLSILKKSVTVLLETGTRLEFPVSEIKVIKEAPPPKPSRKGKPPEEKELEKLEDKPGNGRD